MEGDVVNLYDDDRTSRVMIRDATVTLDDRAGAWGLWRKLTRALLRDAVTRWFK